MYLNTGCWLAPRFKERHQDGCRSPLTYATILIGSYKPQGELWRWCQRAGKSEPFVAHLPPETDLPEQTAVRELSTEVPAVDAPVAAGPKKHRPQSSERESLRKKRY
jgi:hypothetical protein